VTVAPAITPVYLHSPNFLQKTPAKKIGAPADNSRQKYLTEITTEDFVPVENTTHNHASKTKKRSPEGLRFPSQKKRS
jgi:hypothetical protein